MASSSWHRSKHARRIWLIGGLSEAITGSKLPSSRQMLSRFFYLHTVQNKTLHESAAATAKEVSQFWEKSRIPTRQQYHVINQIKQLHHKWQGLKKACTRRTEKQKHNEDEFTSVLDDLFDVAHADALHLIKIHEDREFLLAQREKGRRGSLGPVDLKLAKVEERRCKRKQATIDRSKREHERKVSIVECSIEIPDSNTDSDESSATEGEDSDVKIRMVKERKTAKPVVNIINPDVASALDRTKVSDRNATFILAAAATSLGHSPSELILNKESVRLSRRQHRESTALSIKETFSFDGIPGPLTIHWDGKILPALTGKDTVDRLAVIVSGNGEMKLLGVPKLGSGSGEAQAAAVFQMIDEWKLTERVQLMCFDTTASNTGNKAGACVKLQQKLNKQLISLACRHHIHELIVAKVFDMLMGCSSGPNVRLFERFSAAWIHIDSSSYECAMKDKTIKAEIESLKDNLMLFLRQQLQQYQPRDDYKELLQLSLLFLGDEPTVSNGSIHINTPGAYHRARWMGKIIYSLKIYLFRSQFRLTSSELSGLQQFNMFVVRLYLKAWYTCTSATSAPRNDLQLLKDLVIYRRVNKPVADVAIKTFMRHLWYLSEPLLGLAFFDTELSVPEKVAMVAALSKVGQEDPPVRITIDENCVSEKQLSHFVSENTMKFFASMHIPQDFLFQDPSFWSTNEAYIAAESMVKNLKVVNDAAERGVALIQTFNSAITNQEEQKQYLLQVVESHRQQFQAPKKSLLVQKLCSQ